MIVTDEFISALRAFNVEVERMSSCVVELSNAFRGIRVVESPFVPEGTVLVQTRDGLVLFDVRPAPKLKPARRIVL